MKNFRAVFLSLRINIIIYKADIPHIVGGKMIKCRINSLTVKLFIGSLAACSYRIMYPRFCDRLEWAGDFFEKQALDFEKKIKADFEKRKENAKQKAERITKTEIFSLLCDVYEYGAYISTVFTFILMRGGKCVKCKRFSFVWDSESGLTADLRRLGINEKTASAYDGIYISRAGTVTAFRNPEADEKGIFPAVGMKNPENVFEKTGLKTKKEIIMTNNENNA